MILGYHFSMNFFWFSTEHYSRVFKSCSVILVTTNPEEGRCGHDRVGLFDQFSKCSPIIESSVPSQRLDRSAITGKGGGGRAQVAKRLGQRVHVIRNRTVRRLRFFAAGVQTCPHSLGCASPTSRAGGLHRCHDRRTLLRLFNTGVGEADGVGGAFLFHWWVSASVDVYLSAAVRQLDLFSSAWSLIIFWYIL